MTRRNRSSATYGTAPCTTTPQASTCASESSSTNFLGIPVDGDIVHGEARREQKPLTELAPLIEAVLADEQIEAFGWRQYTPYFNDGDPCVFSVHGFWVASVGDNYEDSNADDLAVGEYSYGAHRSLGEIKRKWNHGAGAFEYSDYVGPDRARYDRCLALAHAIEGGHFDDVLLTAFGDHAEITVKRDGITVDSYSHD